MRPFATLASSDGRAARAPRLLAVVVLLAGLAAVTLYRARNVLVVVNRTGVELVEVTVEVGGGGSIHTFTTVPIGSQRTETFQVGSDGSFEVTATTAAGRTLSGAGGYVSGGSRGERVTITIGPGDGVTITQ